MAREIVTRHPDEIDRAIAAVEARGDVATAYTPLEPETAINSTPRRTRRAGRFTGFALAGAVGATLAGGGLVNPTPASAFENPIVIQGQTSSLHLESTTHFTAEKITAENAAKRYGYDQYSKTPSNWTIHENGTAATLEPDKNNMTHRVKVNGAVIDGWLKVRRDGVEAIPVVVNPRGITYMDLNGGTFRLFPKSQREAAFNKLVGQMRAKEKIEQPGTNVLPVCTPITHETRWVNPKVFPNTYNSQVYAAKNFGADSWSRNPANWEVNNYGGLHLKVDNSGLHHTIIGKGVVIDGYIDEWDRFGTGANDNNSLAITGAPQGPNAYTEVDVRGATIWVPATPGDLRALAWQVDRQHRAAEAADPKQKGVLPIMVCN